MFSPVIVLEDSSASYEMHDLAGMCFGAIENGDGDEASRERTEWNLGLSAQSNGYFPADFYAVNLLECQARCDASAGCVAISYGLFVFIISIVVSNYCQIQAVHG